MYRYSYFVAGRSWLFIALPLFCVLVTGVWVYRLTLHQDVWLLYTPSDLPGKEEREKTAANAIFSGSGYYRVSFMNTSRTPSAHFS